MESIKISLGKAMPTIIIVGFLLSISYFGYNMIETQKKQISTLNEYVGQLNIQNQAIIGANKAITADMRAIKEGMETYNSNILNIKTETAKLATRLSDPSFRKMLKEEVLQAQAQFNGIFNEYLQGINDVTKIK